ncbi:hypothetical protein LZ32DRAFT_111446 [Colletotrichum eremochloae]|nr:hypothetical protein LZ32DRAFT_111446 [Colletotrichum eremochloae]
MPWFFGANGCICVGCRTAMGSDNVARRIVRESPIMQRGLGTYTRCRDMRQDTAEPGIWYLDYFSFSQILERGEGGWAEGYTQRERRGGLNTRHTPCGACTV